MGSAKGQEATRQVEIVCLDELVPEDDLYRRVDALVDWRFVRAAAAPYYAEAAGRPSVDPELKLQHALGRARCRGTPAFHIQLLLGCTAINLKRLATHAADAASGVAAAPLVAVAAPSPASLAAKALLAPAAAPANQEALRVWTLSLCLN
jgi:hypothetical protein